MKIARIGTRGNERPVLIDGDNWFDLSALTPDITGDFLAADGLARAADAHAAGTLRAITRTGDERIGAPIARPGAVICIGMNYAAHAAESGSLPPENPVVFLKTPNTVTGPYDDVAIPRGSAKTDWEVELGIVIGRHTSYLNSPAESAEHIAGLTLANDLSERAFQLEVSGGQWSKGKCAPDFTPLGPYLVPLGAAEQARRLSSAVNGEGRQDSSTGDMIFDVDTIVYELSQYMALEPGDLILTGTPEGVALSGRFPYLAAGDIVEVAIEGLGSQRTRMLAHPDDAAATR